MTWRHLVAILAAAAGSSGALAQTRTTTIEAVSSPGVVDGTTQTEDVRFRTDVAKRMTVPVRLSGTGPYQFLVDTGADRTAISREVATRLKLAAGTQATLHSIASATMVETATLPSLQLTRKPVRIVDAPLLEGINIGADGILGVDSLRSQRILFDFEAKTMSIVPSHEPDFRAEPGTITVVATRRNGRLLLTEAKADGYPVNVVIDTGSEVSIGNAALRKRLLGSKLLSGSEAVVLESVTGEKLNGEYMFVRELTIGGFGLKNLAIVFADAHTFRQLKLDKKPALLLGMNAMRAFKKVSIDFASRKLRVIVPEHSALDTRMAAGSD
jgi:predicted aspartyl protease